jgi:hypothetical protein
MRNEYRLKNIEKQRAYERHKYHTVLKYLRKNDPEVKAKWRKYLQNHRKKNPEKAKARYTISNAKRWKIKTFTILPCSTCGSKKSEAHHPDYTKPLEIVWLCHPCHIKLHNETSGQTHGAKTSLNRDAGLVSKKPSISRASSKRSKSSSTSRNMLNSNRYDGGKSKTVSHIQKGGA